MLVVDDEPHIRAVLRGYLEADGFAVAEAADGEEAVRQVRQGAPDLVLLDVMLPGIDGRARAGVLPPPAAGAGLGL